MPRRMAGNVDHLPVIPERVDGVAAVDGSERFRDGFTRGAENLGAGGIAQRCNAARVIGVVVRD